MEKVTEFLTVLFILSMICERLSEFLKNFLSGKKIGTWYLIGDTTTKFPPDSSEELRRIYRILKLNLLFGFITAFAAHASLFDILRNIESPQKVLGWPGDISVSFDIKYTFNNIAFLLGCFLTGCFLSLGSKFWHDLLDILLAIKNVKQVAVSENVPAFDSLNEDEKFSLIGAAIKENKATWKNNIANYKGVSAAQKLVGPQGESTGALAIRFNISNKKDLPLGAKERVPTSIFYKGYKIPTDVLETGDTVALTGPINDRTMPRPLGSSIGRFETTYSGTLGIIATLTIDGQRHLCGLSCFHVLFPEELKKRTNEIRSSTDPNLIDSTVVYSPSISDSTFQTNIGTVIRGKFTEFIDIAFFVTSPVDVSEAVYHYGKPTGLHQLKRQDENQLDVQICGRTSGLQTGKIIAIKTDQIITYFKDTPALAFKHELEDLIQIKMKTAPGDSGSAVLTHDNKLVGIVVGSDGALTYAIPAKFLESNFNISFNF